MGSWATPGFITQVSYVYEDDDYDAPLLVVARDDLLPSSVAELMQYDAAALDVDGICVQFANEQAFGDGERLLMMLMGRACVHACSIEASCRAGNDASPVIQSPVRGAGQGGASALQPTPGQLRLVGRPSCAPPGLCVCWGNSWAGCFRRACAAPRPTTTLKAPPSCLHGRSAIALPHPHPSTHIWHTWRACVCTQASCASG